MSDIDVRDNPSESRYEVVVDGDVAGFTQYEKRGGTTVFVHTEIGDAYEGQGLASKLVKGALDDLRASGTPVASECSYVSGWIEKHPDYQDLLAG